MSIAPVIDFALTYNPMLATRDLSTIFAWINYGCDIEKDILPTMKEIIKRRPPAKPKISSFSYFSNAIYESFTKRTVVAEKTKEKTQEEMDALRAKNLQWKKDRGIMTSSHGAQDYAWLEQYKQQHGGIG